MGRSGNDHEGFRQSFRAALSEPAPFHGRSIYSAKISVLAALLSCTTWIPALLLFFVKAELQGNGWLWQNLWMAGSIVLSCFIWIAMISLISMAVAVWVKWRIAATALMLGIFFLLPAAAAIVNAILRTQWGNVINFPT